MGRCWYNRHSGRIFIKEPLNEPLSETNWFSPEYFGLMMGVLRSQHRADGQSVGHAVAQIHLDQTSLPELERFSAYVTGAFRWRCAPGGDHFWQRVAEEGNMRPDRWPRSFNSAPTLVEYQYYLEGVGAMALQALIAFDQRLWKRMSEQE